jgi:hypothetical protein
LVFVDHAPSGRAYAGTDTLRRGRYLIQVEWHAVDADDRARLMRIARALVRRLPR